MRQPEEKITALTDALSEVVRGNRQCIETLVIALLSGGSVLMQDVPGVGKTTLAKAVAKAIDVQFHRIGRPFFPIYLLQFNRIYSYNKICWCNFG